MRFVKNNKFDCIMAKHLATLCNIAISLQIQNHHINCLPFISMCGLWLLFKKIMQDVLCACVNNYSSVYNSGTNLSI